VFPEYYINCKSEKVKKIVITTWYGIGFGVLVFQFFTPPPDKLTEKPMRLLSATKETTR